MKGLILLLSLLPVSAYCEVEYLTVFYNVFTYHHNSDTFEDDNGQTRQWNESNKITGIQYNPDQNVGYFIATGDNSYYRNSNLCGVEFSSDDRWYEYGSDVGLATGYEPVLDWGVVPFINPFVRINIEIDPKLTLSLKAGSVNFQAENAFIELKTSF